MRWLLPLVVLLFATGGSSAAASKPTVVFDGDSITVLATPALHQLLDSTYNVEVRAKGGIRLYQSLPALTTALKSHPYAVVENLGTNDALHGGVDPDWLSSWDELIRMTQSTPCVVLTTVNPDTDRLVGKPIAIRINAAIMALAARDPEKYQVADWSGFLSSHLSTEKQYLRPSAWIAVHPTPVGTVELARLDQAALARCGSGTS